MQLSELVCEQEALQFQLVSEGLQAHVTYDSTVLGHSLVTDAVQEAADAALGSGAKAFIDGSIAKGTQWRGSDIDMLVQTDEPLTRSQVESLTEELKKSPMFNPSHVDLGDRAIHVRILGMDIDVVCANTLRHGLRPPAEERFANNPTAGNAARMLKVMASHALLPVPVKNYHLELLTLLSQEAAAARGGAHVADGSMQLVVDVLQAIADDRMPTAVAAETENDLTKDQFASLVTKLKVHVQEVLHLFVMSRVLFPKGGWRNRWEVQSWLLRPVLDASGSVPTMAGNVPRWLVDLTHSPPVGSSQYPDLLVCGTVEAVHPGEEPGATTGGVSKAAMGDPITHKTESEEEPGSMHGNMDGDRLFPDVQVRVSKGGAGDLIAHDTESETEPGAATRVAERGSELGSMTETESVHVTFLCYTCFFLVLYMFVMCAVQVCHMSCTCLSHALDMHRLIPDLQAHGSTAATGDPITHKTESEAEAGSMHGDMDGDRLFPDVLAHGSKAARGDPNTHKTESEVDPGSLHRDMDGDRLFPGLHAHVSNGDAGESIAHKTESATEPGYRPMYSLTHVQSEEVQRLLHRPLGEYTLLGRSLVNGDPTNRAIPQLFDKVFESAQRAAEASRLAKKEETKGRSGLGGLFSDVMQLEAMVEGAMELQSEGQRRVAQRMVEARRLWLMGEEHLVCGRSIPAVCTLAASLRLSCRDGDPFSGFWMVDASAGDDVLYPYQAAINAAMPSYPADALLVLGMFQLNRLQVERAEKACTEGLKLAPNDAYGLLFLLCVIHGNSSAWDLALRASEQLVSLVPNEPIFYYWRAVFKLNMIGSSVSPNQVKDRGRAANKQLSTWMSQQAGRVGRNGMKQGGGKELMEEWAIAAIKDFEHFLSLADEGGRKVPEAHYQIAVLSVMNGDPQCKSVQGKLMERVRAARASEALVLPMLRSDADSGAKGMCNELYNTFTAHDNPPTITGFLADTLAMRMRDIARSDSVSSKIAAKQSVEEAAAAATKRLREMHETTSRIDPSSLSCWTRVLFKEAVRIVDLDEAGHFVQLSDAVEYVCSTPPPAGSSGWTLILQPGKYMQCQIRLEVPTVPVLLGVPTARRRYSLQLLGGRTMASEASPRYEHGQKTNTGIREPEVTLIYGQSRPGPFQRHFSSNHIAIVTGISVVMEDLALVVPHLLDSDTYHCIFLTDQAQLRACGCVFSSPTSPCIAINDSGTRCSLADCWFGPDKERAASAGIVVDNSAYLKAERCQFLRCCEAAVEVRGAGSKAQLKACTFTKCKKQAVVLYSGGEELVMEDCVIENCGDAVMRGLVQVACGKARLRKCSLVNNKTDGVVVQSESRQNAPVLDMSDCKLTGNSTGVLFGFGIGGGGGGSGVLDNNVITNNGTVGLIINEVAPNQLVHLSSNVFRSNGPTLLGAVDVQMFQNVKDQVVVKNNNCGAISCIPISAFDAVKFAKGLKLFK